MRCVIIGGADIKNYSYVSSVIKNEDFIIYCDCGLKHKEKLQLEPDLIIGDFDSHCNPELPVETIVLPTVKDDTDTVYAAKEAIRRGFNEVVLIGALGGRMDHTLGNLSILLMLHNAGIQAEIYDDFSVISSIYPEEIYEVSDDCKFFSLLAADSFVSGLEIHNAKYELSKAELTVDFPLGISNEVLKGKKATVSLEKGRLFVIIIKGPVQ